MPSGLRKTTGNHFEIYYEAPWGGVATDKDSTDIKENQLVAMQNMAIFDEVLCTTAWSNRVVNAGASSGYTDFKWTQPTVADSYCCLLFALSNTLFAMDQYGYLYGLFPDNPPSTGTFFAQLLNPINPIAPVDGPWPANQPPTSVQIVNQVAYISNFNRGITYKYDPFNTPYQIPIATTYCAGKVFGVLDDYLLQFNTNSTGQGIVPNMVNWSGPGEFSTWDPSVDRTAGFNQLPAIEDQLTGFISLASSGLLLSRKSLIQLNPTGIAIGPFQFTVLWTSNVGQGCTFPETVAQYGQLGFLASDNGVFSLSTGGFSDLSAAAKKSIMLSLNNAGYVFNSNFPAIAGAILLYLGNLNYPTPRYILTALNSDGTASVVTWILNPITGTWTNLTTPVGGTAKPKSCKIFAVDTFSSENGTFYTIVPVTYGTFLVVQPNAGSPRNSYIYSLQTSNNQVAQSLSATGPTVAVNLQFRTESIKIGREPTIRRVLIRAYGFGSLNVIVNGISYGVVVINSATPANYLTPGGIYTGQDPQLNITGNFNGVIVKVVMIGTYADGEID